MAPSVPTGTFATKQWEPILTSTLSRNQLLMQVQVTIGTRSGEMGASPAVLSFWPEIAQPTLPSNMGGVRC